MTIERHVIRTRKELDEFFSNFNKSIFSFDTETTSLKYLELKPEGFSFYDGKHSCYVFLADYAKGYINPEHDDLIRGILSVFRDTSQVVGHNLVYDLKVLHRLSMELSEDVELYCTMVADHLLNETRRHGLKYLAEEVLGHQVTAFTEINDHSSEEFFLYAMHDAEWTWELMQVQVPELKEQELDKLFRTVEMPFQRVLLDMEINGMLVDVEKVQKTAKEIKLETERLEVELYESINAEYTITETGIRGDINFNSGKQLAEILFTKLGLPITERTPKGAPKTGSSVIEKLRSKHPFVNTLAVYKKARKLYTAYFADDAQIMSNLDRDNRVRPSFRDTGTATGRLSCSQPNLQQLPKVNKDFPIDTRECFIASPGSTMITCDYSGQEVAVAAEVSKDPTLVDALNKGQDMHLRIANQFYELGIPEECLYTTHAEYNEYKDKFKKERTQAKVITFGLMYGKGAYGFSQDFNIPESEAQGIVDKYFEGMPKLLEAIETSHADVKRNGYVTSMAGRRRHFTPVERYGRFYYLNSSLRQAFNFLIQGFSADMMRMAMTEVRRVGREHPEWNLRPIATVHDEAVYEVNTAYVNQSAKAIKQAFESVVSFTVPVHGDIGIGKNYSEAK